MQEVPQLFQLFDGGTEMLYAAMGTTLAVEAGEQGAILVVADRRRIDLDVHITMM